MSKSPQSRTGLAIILAAGEGSRMRSALPKVMHKVGGLPMLGHAIRAAKESGTERIAVVVGPRADAVRKFIAANAADAAVYEQAEQLGTAHAVLAAGAALKKPADDILALYGDTPLVGEKTLGKMRKALAKGADLVVLGFQASGPSGYGRLIMEKGQLVAIREEADASKDEKAINFCNAGVMAFTGGLAGSLKSIGKSAKGEHYLTDLVAIANRTGKTVVAVEADASEVMGVNSRAELAAAEAAWQQRARLQAMAGGVTMIAPETVFLSYDTKLGRDTLIEPNVWIGPGVTVGEGVAIRAYSHIEGTTIADGAVIGPYARLRPGARIAAGARVGNFVEVKNAAIGKGAKVNHLTYIGDANVGAESNIGAGTITCNYDGFAKHHTEIGAGVFIGSNSALVAPVTIGDGAYVAAGSTITRDVEPDALAIARGRQESRPGGAKKLRARIRADRKPG
jgi:bifunctional UDP-N-acetylglucosamine pyrophosphorylase/glucosamine-1-phosphate N-acetyltransferase